MGDEQSSRPCWGHSFPRIQDIRLDEDQFKAGGEPIAHIRRLEKEMPPRRSQFSGSDRSFGLFGGPVLIKQIPIRSCGSLADVPLTENIRRKHPKAPNSRFHLGRCACGFPRGRCPAIEVLSFTSGDMVSFCICWASNQELAKPNKRFEEVAILMHF